MSLIIGRGIKVEIGKTEGAAKVVSAVTQAKPGSATSAAHGLANKSVGYFTGVTGMSQLDGQAIRIVNSLTNSFDLESLDTTNFPAFTAGNFVPITAWSTLAESTSYQVADGTADKLDATTLIDNVKQEVNGLLNAQGVTLAVNSQDVPSEAMALIESAAINQAYLVFRITLATGATRVFRAQPSLPGENVGKGAIGTGSITLSVKGVILKGAA